MTDYEQLISQMLDEYFVVKTDIQDLNSVLETLPAIITLAVKSAIGELTTNQPPIIVNVDMAQFARVFAQEMRPIFEAFLRVQSGQSGQVDSGQMSSGQFDAPAPEVRAISGQVVESVHPQMSSGKTKHAQIYTHKTKREDIREYAQIHAHKTHKEIAAHFQVNTKTVQRALKSEK